MAFDGPIVLIEDEPNDVEVILKAVLDVGIKNEVRVFHTANEGYDYLVATKERPLVILCDIRMPAVNGLALRKSIIANEYLKKKSIPFVFMTGMVHQEIIDEAYQLDVQGFFSKGSSYEALKAQLSCIYIYWRGCLHPNS